MNLHHIPPDLLVPGVTAGKPAPGKRVRQVLPGFAEGDIHHVIHLPLDDPPSAGYPVLVEYPGNRTARNILGDVCEGTVEGCNLGYGLSGGRGFLWVCLPFVDPVLGRNAAQWWGDVSATVEYAKVAVSSVCAEFGGDASRVILAGFSRGAIACNHIGLHDDKIASLWAGFITHSHYDGVFETWPYPGADRASALQRLARVGARPVWISQEGSTATTRRYLDSTGIALDVTYLDLPYANHTDIWVLRNLPERRKIRDWMTRILDRSPLCK